MSCSALNPLTSLWLAPRHRGYMGRPTHTAAAAAVPQYHGQTAWSTGTGHCRDKDTHKMHHLAWITNHQLNDYVLFCETLLPMWPQKQRNGTPVLGLDTQTWKWQSETETFKAPPITDRVCEQKKSCKMAGVLYSLNYYLCLFLLNDTYIYVRTPVVFLEAKAAVNIMVYLQIPFIHEMKTKNQEEASSGCNYIKRYLSSFVRLYHSCALSLTFAKGVLPTSHSFFPLQLSFRRTRAITIYYPSSTLAGSLQERLAARKRQ